MGVNRGLLYMYPAVRVVVLTGSGDQFCLGADTKALDFYKETDKTYADTLHTSEMATPGHDVHPQFNHDLVWQWDMRLTASSSAVNLLNPLFFQELLGYSPWKSGSAVLPRGFGTLAGMLVIGQLSRRAFDTRWLVGLGFVLMAYALWSMSHWTLDVGIGYVRFAMILSGLGSGLIFPAMSAATLACVSKERMGYAPSLYNMMRNTGSAIGISLVTNMLNSQEQTHRLISRSISRPLMPGAPIGPGR
jgi:Major Facilitator Superfamily